jgi:TolA-binding protein
MSDKDKPQGRPELDEDEDDLLLGDFSDLFAADEVPTAVSATPADEATAGSPGEPELLLDGFDPAPSPDVGLDGEIFIPEVALDEEEPEGHEGDEGHAAAANFANAMWPDDGLPGLESHRAARDDGQPAAAVPTTEATEASAPPSAAAATLARPQLIGGVIVLLLGLLLSLSATWMVMGQATQVDTLTQEVSALQQRLLAQSRRGNMAAPDPRLESQLTQLDERVNELAVIIEGPMSHLRESSQQELAALALRLEQLERLGQQGPGATEKPLTHKPSPVVVEGAAPAVKGGAPLEGGGGWVINLLSLSSSATAQQELARLRQLGVRAEQQVINQGGHLWYRLRVTGFDSYEGAKAYIETVERQTGFNSAWVGKAQE